MSYKPLYYLISSVLVTTFFIGCKPDTKLKNTENTEISESLVISDTLPWSERLAESIIKRHPEAWQTEGSERPEWNYKIGLLLTSFEGLYESSGKKQYKDYIKTFADTLINESGVIKGYEREKFNIDMINAGKILFNLYEESKDSKYIVALDTLRSQLKTQPRTSSNGFWHKKIYPDQMWLDGLYMGAPFYAQYNTLFENGDKLDDIAHQFELIWEHTIDSETGLLYHAWDESKQMDWADKTTGKSPNFWSRSMGWYAMALVDVLDYFPQDHPKRALLISYLNQLSEALVKFQDESGLWYQVTDMPERKGNYFEASGTCMFIYAFVKGVKKGYLPSIYRTYADRGFKGMIDNLVEVEKDGEVHITNICKSAGLGGNPYRDGSFEYYISEPIVTDNLHGTGPFILAANELQQ